MSRGLGNRAATKVSCAGDAEGRLENSSRRAARRRGCQGFSRIKTLGTGSSGERASEGSAKKRRERRAPGKLGLAVGSEGLRERNSRRGATPARVNNVRGRERGPVRMKASKSRRADCGSLRKWVSGPNANGKGAGSSRRARVAARREKPLNERDPGRGSGMKQACEPERGGNRRGVEKARGRNEARGWDLSRKVAACG